MTDSEIIDIHLPAEEKEGGYPEINLQFRKPTIEELGIVHSAKARGDSLLKITLTLFKTVFVSGDEWVLDDAMLLGQLATELQEVIQGYAFKIDEKFNAVAKRKEYDITLIIDENDDSKNVRFKISRPNVDQFTVYEKYIETNSVIATRELYKACWIEGDQKVMEDSGCLMSMMQALQRIAANHTESIKKQLLPRQQ
ncbi:MAG: hypothetical protein JSS79_05270 [Bacteroidetes bacterium]|nr:hypothetical protein [Bacteroidota bacterium]